MSDTSRRFKEGEWVVRTVDGHDILIGEVVQIAKNKPDGLIECYGKRVWYNEGYFEIAKNHIVKQLINDL